RTTVLEEPVTSSLLGTWEGILGLAANPQLPERCVRPIVEFLLPSCGRHMGFAHGMGTRPYRLALANLIRVHKLDASCSIALELFAFISGTGSSPAKDTGRRFDRRDAICALREFPSWPLHWKATIAHLSRQLTQEEDAALREAQVPLSWRDIIWFLWAIPALLLGLLGTAILSGVAGMWTGRSRD
ncbi:MAG: hypothetical protein H0W69_09230, partial [Gemmatimonadaceae bacterium]|nr:hypothetical protein [Gemmatimonadaceae bacterium]